MSDRERFMDNNVTVIPVQPVRAFSQPDTAFIGLVVLRRKEEVIAGAFDQHKWMCEGIDF